MQHFYLRHGSALNCPGRTGLALSSARIRLAAGITASLLAWAMIAPVSPALAAEASPLTSPWVKGSLSQVRLISGGFDGKTYKAGIQIRLKGAAHTYWRNPGDGGVPPVFDFSKSANLAEAKPYFPAPTRSGEPGEEVIGYAKEVIFPVHVTPAANGKPVLLALKLHYAACEKICVPETAVMQIRLDPAAKNPGAASMIAAFEAKLPKALSVAGAPKLSIAPQNAGKSWIFRLENAGKGASDIFVEGPEGWYFDRKMRAPGEFELILAQKPEDAKALPAVHITLTSAKGAFEGKRPLP